jgi:hypothetical protein
LVVRDGTANEGGFKRFGFGNGMLFSRLSLEPTHDAGGSGGGCHNIVSGCDSLEKNSDVFARNQFRFVEKRRFTQLLAVFIEDFSRGARRSTLHG